MRAVLVKAGDDGENDRGSDHQPTEECEIRIRAKFVAEGQNQIVHTSHKEFARGDREKPQGHDGALHRIRRLRIGKFQSSDRNHCFAKREDGISKKLPVDARFKPRVDLALNPNDHHK